MFLFNEYDIKHLHVEINKWTYIDCEVEEGMHFCTSTFPIWNTILPLYEFQANLRSRKPGSHIGPGLVWLKIYFTLFIKSKIWNTNLFPSVYYLNMWIIQDNWFSKLFPWNIIFLQSTSGFSERYSSQQRYLSPNSSPNGDTKF